MNALFDDGHCNGPLFAPVRKIRPPKRKSRGWRWYYERNLKATPKWANQWKIDFIYAVARIRGKSVDHIVPIAHPLVCGLHCEANMEILSVEENYMKGNNYWPDMPEYQLKLEF
jgi:hypothetical protein